MEFTTTKHNPLMTPYIEVWGWDVALYLFFSGLAAGVLILGSIQYLYFGEKGTSKVMRGAIGVASLIVPLAMLGLLHDLANKVNLLAFYKYWNLTSTMAIGARALLVIPPIGLLFALALMESNLPQALNRWALRLAPAKAWLGRLTLASGLFLGTYTGVLLSANFGRPLWNTPLLPVLFLVSGLSTAAAALGLFSRESQEQTRLLKLDVNLILAEMAVIALMLLGFGFATRSGHEAAGLLVGGDYSSAFWIFIVGIGLVIPLILEQLHIKGKAAHSALPALMVLAGGLALRVIVVLAGQASLIPN